MTFKPGENPRLSGLPHRERGPKRYVYTLQQVADFLGMSRSSVLSELSRRHIKLSDFTELINYVLLKYAQRNKPLPQENIAADDAPLDVGDLDDLLLE